MGRDQSAILLGGQVPGFNPRARMGRDYTPPRARSDRRVSIHAPAWGATYQGGRDADNYSE